MLPAVVVGGLQGDKNQVSTHKNKKTNLIIADVTKKHKAPTAVPKKQNDTTNQFNSIYLNAILIFVIGILSGVLFLQLAPHKRVEPIPTETPVPSATSVKNVTQETSTQIPRPKFTMFTRRKDQNNLSVIRRIINLLGYTEVGLEDDWNLLWGFEVPFQDLKHILTDLKPHQMVNHMPGMSHLVHKAVISTSGSPFMPPAFKLPKDKEKFLSYAAKHPNKIFVEKNNGHRNVAVKKPKDIDLESNSTFVQEFITNPYLVDGYKFDIGIYTILTSLDPLRLYIYTGDVMFRYCREKFHPFDGNVLSKYVVGDAYRPTWEVPSLVKYFNRFGGGMKASFDAYVRDQGQDPSKIWEQAEEVIRYTVLSKAPKIVETWKQYKRHNFFEIIRVDLIVDTDFKIHLIEANISPNLHSNRFEFNYIVFEQVLYNALQLTGVGSPIKERGNTTRFGKRLVAVTADKNVASNLNECVEHNCHKTCNDIECNLCIPCLTEAEYDTLANAQREHIHRADLKRLFPVPIVNVNEFDLEEATQNLTESNKWMTKWYYHKCLYDKSWCQ